MTPEVYSGFLYGFGAIIGATAGSLCCLAMIYFVAFLWEPKR